MHASKITVICCSFSPSPSCLADTFASNFLTDFMFFIPNKIQHKGISKILLPFLLLCSFTQSVRRSKNCENDGQGGKETVVSRKKYSDLDIKLD